MFIVDLGCDRGHSFEGWYGSFAEYKEILDAGELTCPLCGSASVSRQLSATAIGASKTPERAAQTSPLPAAATNGAMDARSSQSNLTTSDGQESSDAKPQPSMPLPMQRALAAVVEHIQRTHEDVGNDFTRRARAMHQGEEKQRPIMGQASNAEENQLREEGVAVVKIPIPDIMKN